MSLSLNISSSPFLPKEYMGFGKGLAFSPRTIFSATQAHSVLCEG